MTLTGFDAAEIDLIVGDDSVEEDEHDSIPEFDPKQVAVTKIGDLWKLGEHRLLCGSALDESAFATLMGGLLAQIVFVDPPYNVRIDGHASGNGSIEHREFPMASGEMDETQFTRFLRDSFELLVKHSAPGSVHFICMDWRHMGELLHAAVPVYDKRSVFVCGRKTVPAWARCTVRSTSLCLYIGRVVPSTVIT